MFQFASSVDRMHRIADTRAVITTGGYAAKLPLFRFSPANFGVYPSRLLAKTKCPTSVEHITYRGASVIA